MVPAPSVPSSDSPIRLAAPDVAFHDSWVEVVAEFGGDGTAMQGSGWFGMTFEDTSAQALAGHVATLEQESPGLTWTDGVVGCAFRWIVEGDDLLGFLAIRHRMPEALRDEIGHIGYSLRPSARGRGVAAQALALALPEAAALGIDVAVLTCDEDNVASYRTMLANGAVLESVAEGKRRYRITLAG